MEKNSLILDGSHHRSFVCELEVGDYLAAYDKTVVKVERLSDTRTKIILDNGSPEFFYNPSTTLLVRN